MHAAAQGKVLQNLFYLFLGFLNFFPIPRGIPQDDTGTSSTDTRFPSPGLPTGSFVGNQELPQNVGQNVTHSSDATWGMHDIRPCDELL